MLEGWKGSEEVLSGRVDESLSSFSVIPAKHARTYPILNTNVFLWLLKRKTLCVCVSVSRISLRSYHNLLSSKLLIR